jgi:hypothetical protein
MYAVINPLAATAERSHTVAITTAATMGADDLTCSLLRSSAAAAT